MVYAHAEQANEHDMENTSALDGPSQRVAWTSGRRVVAALLILGTTLAIGIFAGAKYHSPSQSTANYLSLGAPDCGSGSGPEGAYSRKCRTSCKSGETHITVFDKKCSGAGAKCCMCNSRGWSGCTVEI
eukprot:TRINITY_DN2760_c0_g1_i1.p1 TRINITY_DN2760_c0_g1~~TRINITY_DN2760_c0_g1_i1.p1  ORF type:complete len:148 (+),score=6.93 TRINITY_DN2760_c0_g1_i1:59-445(+)